MTAPVEVRDQASTNLSAPDRLGPNRLAQDASGLVPDGRCRRDHARERAAAAERKARKARALAEVADPSQSFARVYRAALAEGVDLLEERDAIYEMKCCGRLPVEGCVCVPVREKKGLTDGR